MAAVNKVILIGNLGRDPELRKTPGGAAVTSFSLATTEKFTDKNGQRQEQTEWHNIVAWNRSAETMAQYLTKGSSVYIEGKLRTQSWEDNGQKKYRTEIVVQSFQFVGGRGGQGGQQGGFGGAQQQGGFGEPPMGSDNGFGGDDQFGGKQGGGFGGGQPQQQQQQQPQNNFGGDQGGFGGGNQGGGFGGGQQQGGGFSGGSAPMPNTQQHQAPQAPHAPAGLPVEDELPF